MADPPFREPLVRMKDQWTGPTTEDKGTPPTAWFVLWRQGTDKDHEWRIISEVLVAHDTDELLTRVFDRYPGVQQATRVKFIPADSGVTYVTSWERET